VLKRSSIDDFERPHPRYWSVTVIRLLLLKKRAPADYAALARMINHNEAHSADEETWSLYKREIVDFLLDDCRMADDDFTADEIFHALGAVDVNSVKINAGGKTAKGLRSAYECAPPAKEGSRTSVAHLYNVMFYLRNALSPFPRLTVPATRSSP